MLARLLSASVSCCLHPILNEDQRSRERWERDIGKILTVDLPDLAHRHHRAHRHHPDALGEPPLTVRKSAAESKGRRRANLRSLPDVCKRDRD
jgi:hypothetical protein